VLSKQKLTLYILKIYPVPLVISLSLRCVTRLLIYRCFFGDYTNEDVESRTYDEILDVPNLLTLMENYLKDYNGVSKRPMNLAIFLFAVEHVSRICRVLKQPGGHMLLVGVGGSGRQSLTRLAASVSAMQVFQVIICGNNEVLLFCACNFSFKVFHWPCRLNLAEVTPWLSGEKI
jgi:hypothetical protein